MTIVLGIVKVILSIIFIVAVFLCAIVGESYWYTKGCKSKLIALVCFILAVLFILAAVKLGVPIWLLEELFGPHGLIS